MLKMDRSLYMPARELERAVGLSRHVAARLALRGEIGFRMAPNGRPLYAVADAMRIVAARAQVPAATRALRAWVGTSRARPAGASR